MLPSRFRYNLLLELKLNHNNKCLSVRNRRTSLARNPGLSNSRYSRNKGSSLPRRSSSSLCNLNRLNKLHNPRSKLHSLNNKLLCQACILHKAL